MPTGSLCNKKTDPPLLPLPPCSICPFRFASPVAPPRSAQHQQRPTSRLQSLGIPTVLTHCTTSIKKKKKYVIFTCKFPFFKLQAPWRWYMGCCGLFVAFCRTDLPARVSRGIFYLRKFHLPLCLPRPRRKLLINTPAVNVFSFPRRAQQVKSQPPAAVSTLLCPSILPRAPRC